MAVDLTQLIDFNLLKRYDTNLKVWVQEAINNAGELVFVAEIGDLPVIGNGNTLYIVGTELYSWDGAQYVKLSGGASSTSIARIANVPIGTIVIWSGAISNIPSNWALCDGQEGRPDLRNKFIVGAGDRYNVGANGEIVVSENITDNAPSYYSLCYIIKVQDDNSGVVNFGELPPVGVEDTLYITNDGNLKIWNPDTNAYDAIGEDISSWDTF